MKGASPTAETHLDLAPYESRSTTYLSLITQSLKTGLFSSSHSFLHQPTSSKHPTTSSTLWKSQKREQFRLSDHSLGSRTIAPAIRLADLNIPPPPAPPHPRQMSLRKRGRKQKKQQTLAFEPVAEATNTAAAAGSHDSWLGKGLSPARVRVSSPSGKERGSSSPSGSRLVKAFEMARTKKSKKQQQTLETSLGKHSSFSRWYQASTSYSYGSLVDSLRQITGVPWLQHSKRFGIGTLTDQF